MQFELKHNIGERFLQIKFFETPLPPVVWLSIANSLQRIGGQCDGNMSNWTLPAVGTTSHIICEIIRNTCFVCGGLMQDGTIMLNVLPSSVEPIKQVKVRKCLQCGHSHT